MIKKLILLMLISARVDQYQLRPAVSSFFYLFLLSVNSRHERAYQRLKEKAGYDYITDIRIRESLDILAGWYGLYDYDRSYGICPEIAPLEIRWRYTN